MTALPGATAAAVFLRHLYAAPVEAREQVDRIEQMGEQDRILVLLHLAARAPGTLSDALNSLPCLHGCAHRRHDDGSCLAAFVDAEGLDRTCECSPFAAEPVVVTLTPAILRHEEHAADQRADAASGAL